ncbi:uncharacterized protein LOC124467673 isoform X2 [Hypomesus transpacificus]|uniref:uncharacterized protein LOC124467673 isoform X2 n=1 Tax=Hypomesus transpacificus TaxID=137520 RepID=UPI001F07FECA|nr:uncharacterized protein LOC124467673 isoform X2 [Hypomesus transpacificus]
MEVVLLLFLLVRASHGIETSCDARQSGTQCYGALNGTVVLHLTDIISGYELRFAGLIRNLVFVMKNQKVVYFNKKNEAKNDSRIYFETKTGTLRINKIWKEYSDNYTLQITNDSSGATSDRILQLSIEAPVSSPRLVISECLPQGQMRMSCSCKGDSPWYSWTLNGQALKDSRVVHDKESSSVTLERGMSGQLTCTVNNHISNATVDLDVSTCNGTKYVNCTSSNGTEVSDWVSPTGPNLCTRTTTTNPTTTLTTSDMIVIVAGSVAGVLLIGVLLGIYFVQCRKKTAASAEDEGEVTYADVRFVTKNQDRQKKKKQPPVEVVYGEVKVSGAASRQEQRPSREVEYGEVMIMTRPGRKVDKPQEECVYSSVR